jgi:hypothetical protein
MTFSTKKEYKYFIAWTTEGGNTRHSAGILRAKTPQVLASFLQERMELPDNAVYDVWDEVTGEFHKIHGAELEKGAKMVVQSAVPITPKKETIFDIKGWSDDVDFAELKDHPTNSQFSHNFYEYAKEAIV